MEQFFDGVDKAAVWHRRVAMAGTILIGVHIATTGNPNATQLGPTLGTIGIIGLATLTVRAIAPRWRSITPRRAAPAGLSASWRHRPSASSADGSAATGCGAASTGSPGSSSASASPTGSWTRRSSARSRCAGRYVAVGGVGLAFYLYRELLARHFAQTHDYEVSSVEPIDDASYEIWLRPLGERFAFRPGQFALVNLEARDGWHRHPFTIASGPQTRSEVRITVRALGDFTSSIGELVDPVCRPSSAAPKGTSTTPGPSTRYGRRWIGVAPIEKSFLFKS